MVIDISLGYRENMNCKRPIERGHVPGKKRRNYLLMHINEDVIESHLLLKSEPDSVIQGRGKKID